MFSLLILLLSFFS